MIVIRRSDRDVKPSGLIGDFKNSRLMPASGFPLTLSHLRFIIHTLYHNKHKTHTIFTYTQSS